MMTRREFVSGALAAAAAPRASFVGGAYSGKVCLFSKHLPEMNWKEVGQSVKRLGFAGVDLTVRKGGHVAPEKAPEDLPKAVAAIREEGVEVPMITTELTSATPLAKALLSTAAKLSIPYFKPGYYRYKFVDVRRELEEAGKEFRGLAELAKQVGIQVGYHNHAAYLGAPVWDIAQIIDTLDPKWVGYYFDICHAVTEGGNAGWRIAVNLVAPRLKMIALKDFYWEKTASKGWRVKMCPLGEGMVDWKGYFKILASSGFQGPVSLHLEYDIPGTTAVAQQENTLAAAERDLRFLTARMQEAYA